jgi:hypothetical protein
VIERAAAAGVAARGRAGTRLEVAHLTPHQAKGARAFRRNAKVRLWPIRIGPQALAGRPVGPLSRHARGAGGSSAGLGFEVEDRTVVGPRQARREPGHQRLGAGQCRDPLVGDRRKDRAVSAVNDA